MLLQSEEVKSGFLPPFNRPLFPVDDRIDFSEPRHAEDDGLYPKSADVQAVRGGSVLNSDGNVGILSDGASLIRGSVYVEHFDGGLERRSGESAGSDKVLVDEGSSCSTVDKGFGVDVFLFTL